VGKTFSSKEERKNYNFNWATTFGFQTITKSLKGINMAKKCNKMAYKTLALTLPVLMGASLSTNIRFSQNIESVST
jgi:hypothetical protein